MAIHVEHGNAPRTAAPAPVRAPLGVPAAAQARTEMLVHPQFLPLADRFFSMYRHPHNGGGALVAYVHGEKVLDVWAGYADRDRRWDSDTVSLSFSTGKGVASTVTHRLAERGIVDYDTPVAAYWPEFGAAGKGEITIRDVLTHRAGLHKVRGLVPGRTGLLDYETVVEALAAAAPDPRRRRGPGTTRSPTAGWWPRRWRGPPAGRSPNWFARRSPNRSGCPSSGTRCRRRSGDVSPSCFRTSIPAAWTGA